MQASSGWPGSSFCRFYFFTVCPYRAMVSLLYTRLTAAALMRAKITNFKITPVFTL